MASRAGQPCVVITSIFPPSDAVRGFVRLGLPVVVVGDRKTPRGWSCRGVDFIDVDQQSSLRYQILDHLPFDHYARKMIGYLVARERGADIIVDSDDDNSPGEDWSYPAFDGRYDAVPSDLGFVNVYRSFTDQSIWPRGFPLRRILAADAIIDDQAVRSLDVQVGVWQGLADGEPDVDAIFRLTRGEQCVFERRTPLVLETGTISPFNSQNTIFRGELFPLLYLPGAVRFRFTDILRGLVAQPIMWNAGYRLGFLSPNVTQDRNPHDLLDDFESELDCYLLPERIVEVVEAALHSDADISENMLFAYEALADEGIVPAAELAGVEAWLADVAA
jgi:hypothetical protein